jgi:predicted ribosome quality control (RQC) complex YloA/Tae2 family protein
VDAAVAEAYLGLNEVDLARQYYESAKQKASKGDKVDPARLERIEKRLEEEGKQKG